MTSPFRAACLLLPLIAAGGCGERADLAQPTIADRAEGDAPAAPRGAIPPSKGGLADAYRGVIEPELAVTVRLKREGDQLTGSYFYDAKGMDIPLSGSLDEGGAVVLHESAGGKKSAEIRGRIDVAGTLAGEWSDGAAPRKIRLDPIERRAGEPAIVRKRWVHLRKTPRATAPPEARIKQCNKDLSYPEVYGLADPAVEAAINEKLKAAQIPARPDDACETPYARNGSYAVHWNRAGVLSVSYTWDHACEACPRSRFGGAVVDLRLDTGAEIPFSAVLRADQREKLFELLRPFVQQRLKATEGAEERDARALTTAYMAGDYVFEEAGIRLIGFFRLQPSIQALDGGFGALVPWATITPLLDPASPAAAVWIAAPSR